MKSFFIPVRNVRWHKTMLFSQGLILFICILFCVGCPINPSNSEILISGIILQPSSPSYDEDKSIIFQAQLSLDSDSVHWQSSMEGDLGAGVWLSRKLLPGNHIITLLCQGREIAQKIIDIEPVVYQRGKYRLLGLGLETNQVLLSAGKYSPFFYSLDSKRRAITIQNLIAAKSYFPTVALKRIPDFEENILEFKEFSLMTASLPLMTTIRKHRSSTRNYTSQCLPRYSANTYVTKIGQTREFLVADTTGVQVDGFNITGRLAFASDRLSIWVDENAQISDTVFSSFLNDLKYRAWPRVLSIWGSDWADTDNDNALAVLITPLINQQQKAIGFFNPADLYPRNTDSRSTTFNPVSNEMDIIYLATPDDDPSIFAYSINSILATFCHEATHLIGFSRTYYIPTSSGQNVSREELFLDEGLAHLTESLCGYGESGGNLAFFAKYLENPEQYSLCKADADGSSDSMGKRGMTAAFLSWLFWEKGGAIWDDIDPSLITDTGGLSFLRHLLATSQRGLVNISASAGSDVQSLLVRWFTEIDLQDNRVLSLPAIYKDPIGGEPITMSPFYGNVLIGSKVYSLNGPVRKDLSYQNICLPYSAIWGHTINVADKKTINVYSSIVGSGSYACFNMVE